MLRLPSALFLAGSLLIACQAAPQAIVVTPGPATTPPQGSGTAPTMALARPAATNPTSAPVASGAAPAQAQTPCEFGEGFTKMRESVGAAVVGECQENERQNPGNG